MGALLQAPPSTKLHKVTAVTPSGSTARTETVTGANGAGTIGW